jgi:hypothetical protein
MTTVALLCKSVARSQLRVVFVPQSVQVGALRLLIGIQVL